MALPTPVLSPNDLPLPEDMTEEDLFTNQELRKRILESFLSETNTARKAEAFKAYECLKDKTINYVLDLLHKQFDLATLREMQYAMANVSIFRKVITKLAKVYANGVKRTMPADSTNEAEVNAAKEATNQVEEIAKIIGLNEIMKKTNRYYRAFWNTLLYVRPLELEDGSMTISPEVKPPFSYDVVPQSKNPKAPLAVICSDYTPQRPTLYSLGDPAFAGRGRGVGVVRDFGPNDPNILRQSYSSTTDQTPSEEKDGGEFIWWTRSYHFTTNCKGELVDKDETDGANPLGELPFVNFCGEQDLGFWAEGGNDLVDAGVKINGMISNIRHVAIQQGYGQLYMTGKNLPKSVKVGPTHCIQLNQDDGEPAPTIGFLSSNPPLESLARLIEMDVALMLTTNNLSSSGFSTSLKGGKDFASGVALMIDRSESMEDIEEQQLVFVALEPKVWHLIGRWIEILGPSLTDELRSIKVPPELGTVQIAFPPSKPILSETDELNALVLRKTLGINTMVELIMRDDPSLTEEAAQEKLDKIMAERQANAAAFGLPGVTDNGGNKAQGDGSNGLVGGNGGQPGFSVKAQDKSGNQGPNQG